MLQQCLHPGTTSRGPAGDTLMGPTGHLPLLMGMVPRMRIAVR
jgi:hypothetical protein